MEQKHKRRIHYSGRYPRRFEEKYKEHDPEHYAETVSHVIEKGSTPAGMHISIMVDQILSVLSIRPGQKGLDATLGYGGHTQKMLECLQGKGHLTALDVDPIESVKTEARLRKLGYGPEILSVRHINFSMADQIAEQDGPFDFILADLGVSSMQIDNPERGFSYKTDGPLDLRMDPLKGDSAAMRLLSITQEEFAGMLEENADEPYAMEIADEVYKAIREGKSITRTSQLRRLIEQALWNIKDLSVADRKEEVKKSCQRTFQALRIDVNSEYEVLYEFLQKLPQLLAAGGRVAILTVHAGEDRLVKKAFKLGKKEGVYQDASKDVIRPGRDECIRNSRAKSAKLRWAVRAGI